MIDYQKLENDLRDIKSITDEAIKNIPDNGTYTKDCVLLRLPRAKESVIMSILQSVGLTGYKDTWFGSRGFLINFGNGLSEKRAIAINIAVKKLISKGYDCQSWS